MLNKGSSAHDLIGQRVFILNVQHYASGTWSRPDPLPFAHLDTLKRHACDLIARQLSHLDQKRRRQIITYLEAKRYDKVIHIFRSAQMENKTAIPLDFYWSEGASAIM